MGMVLTGNNLALFAANGSGGGFYGIPLGGNCCQAVHGSGRRGGGHMSLGDNCINEIPLGAGGGPNTSSSIAPTPSVPPMIISFVLGNADFDSTVVPIINLQGNAQVVQYLVTTDPAGSGGFTNPAPIQIALGA